jgi:hypothetical protein
MFTYYHIGAEKKAEKFKPPSDLSLLVVFAVLFILPAAAIAFYFWRQR